MRLLPEFTSIVDESFTLREIRAERLTCQVWLVVILLTYAIFMVTLTANVDRKLVLNITLLVAVVGGGFALIMLLLSRGLYSPYFKYLNTFLQVSLVSGAIFFDNMSQGPAYTLSSMPPLAYALVPTITAFRLQPWLSLFAGLICGGQFLLLYFFVLQPDPELVRQIPSLGLGVTMMKVIILVALGVASAFAASYLANYFVSYGNERELSNRLHMSFGRFVSPEIVDKIESSKSGKIPTTEQEAAIVFGDIRGFTNYSTRISSREVTELLNDYFEIVCEVVEAEGGMVNKFLGDGYLAFFGIYSEDSHPCDAAVRAILRIGQETDVLLEPHGLKAGAAANWGKIITGEIGSEGRCEFTGIGPAVNITSRLEGLNARLETRFLVTQEFKNELEAGTCSITDMGEHALRGLDRKVPVFEVSA